MKLKIFCDTAISVEKQYNEWEVGKIIHEVQMRIKDCSPTLIIIAVWYTEPKVIVPHVCSCCGCADTMECTESGTVGCPVD